MKKAKHTRFSVYSLLKETFQDWLDDKALRLSAALAYYSIFSIAPLLVIIASVAGIIFGPEAVRGHLDEQLQSYVGQQEAETIQSMVQSTSPKEKSIWATVLGFAVLMVAASGVFAQLKDALNTIWEVEPKPGKGLAFFIRDRFLSFSMVLGTGFLLLVSLVFSTLLGMLTGYMESVWPLTKALWVGISWVLSVGLSSVLFGMIFRYLPDVEIEWKDVGIGALATAVLFEIGKYLLGFYLGRESMVSAYGAAGAGVLLLLWVYYASLILLLGAEFTQVFAKARGSRIKPDPHAQPVNTEKRKQEGLHTH